MWMFFLDNYLKIKLQLKNPLTLRCRGNVTDSDGNTRFLLADQTNKK